MSITAVVLTKNEEINIERAIRSLSWCNEIVVVDDGSTDKTLEIAARFEVKVVQHPFASFAEQRNWAMENLELQGDWILHLDADEFSTPEFQVAVRNAMMNADSQVAAFALCRRTIFLGKVLSRADGFPVYIMRLVRKGRGKFANSGHGEVPIPAMDGSVEKIKEPFMHDVFSKGLSNWWDRHNRYSSREADREIEAPVSLPWSNLFSRDRAKRRSAMRDAARVVPGRPLLRFFYQYFFKFGIFDGRRGFQYCALMAIYEYMIELKRQELVLRSKKMAICKEMSIDKESSR